MKRTRKYECVIQVERAGGSTVFSRFIYVITLSQFRGPDYLAAWDRPGELRVVNQATAACERRRHCYEDMDNLVYDISLFLCLFFLKYMCTEGVPQQVFTK